MTASAVARSSSRWRWSRALPKGMKWRLAGASLPSAVVAAFIKTKGRAPAPARVRFTEGIMPEDTARGNHGAAGLRLTFQTDV